MNQYNLYNLEASFLNFLNSGNKKLSKVTIKNYLSDLRHFFGWYFFKLKANSELNELVEKLDFPNIVSKSFDKILVAQYRAYQEQNNIPLQTANRRLSTLRKLSVFFISQQWIKSNPTSQLKNIEKKTKALGTKYYIEDESTDLILNEYKRALQGPLRPQSEASQNLNSSEATRILEDINEFLNFK